MPGFVTQPRRVLRAFSDEFSRVGPLVGSAWTFFTGEDGDDALLENQVVVHPTATADVAPVFIFAHDLDPFNLDRPVRASVSFRLASADVITDAAVSMRLNVADSSVLAAAMEVRADSTTTAHVRLVRNDGLADTISDSEEFPLNVATWYRMGLELQSGTLRAYCSPGPTELTDQHDTPTNNAAMLPRVELVGELIWTPPWRMGLGIGGVQTGASGLAQTVVDDFLCEEIEGAPYAPPQFPGGAFFEMSLTPYTVYKTTSQLHYMLLNAKI